MLNSFSKKAEVEEAITTQRNYFSPDMSLRPQISRQNSHKVRRTSQANKSSNAILAIGRLKEITDKKQELSTARERRDLELPIKTSCDVFIRDEIGRIFEALEIDIQFDMPIIDQLKLLEGKFEQFGLEYRTVKSEYPDLFIKLRREFYNTLKGKTLELMEQKRAIENEKRTQRNLHRAIVGSKNKHFRHPLQRNYLVSRKLNHSSSHLLAKSSNDQSFLFV